MTVEEIDLYWMKADDLAKYLPDGGCAKLGAKSAGELAEKLLSKAAKAADCPEIDQRMAEAIDAVLSIGTRLPESDPMQEKVGERLFEYGSPDADSPILLTSNSKLTQKILKEIFDIAKVKAFVIPVETNGYTMDNSAAVGAFTPMAVMKAITESGIGGRTSSKKAIISGLVANQKNGIERITRWSLGVGPVSGYELPLYLLSM
jgi:CO dehydrogenase/acetyl-CoA synthase gamma subunit (corrinoid Fe-S protein)